MKSSLVSCVEELQKLGAITDDQARAAFDRLQTLENNKPTPDQVLRYGALGAGAGMASRGLADVIEHGVGGPEGALAKMVPRRYAAAAATGGLMAGAMPLIRSSLDRRAEAGKLRQYLRQPELSTITHSSEGADVPETMPKTEV